MEMRQFILLLWRLIDPLYYLCTRLTYIDYGENIFRVRLTKYKGYPVTLADGTCINKNDFLIKIHLHNARLLSELIPINDDFQRAKVFYHNIKKSLPGLALFIYNHPKREEIKAVIGISSLKLGSNRLGFEIYDLKSSSYKQIKKLALLPINFLSSGIMGKGHFEPAYIFMAKEILLDKHLNLNPEKEQVIEPSLAVENEILI